LGLFALPAPERIFSAKIIGTLGNVQTIAKIANVYKYQIIA
jgi:hypothetical protein